jgi:hypothetical protein
MMIAEHFEKLFIVCKAPIDDIFNKIFSDESFEYRTLLNGPKFLENKKQPVIYYMKNTIDNIKNGIKNKILTVDIIQLSSNIPHNNYSSEPNLKKLNSFDDCTITYIANKLQSRHKEYKIISSDLKMFKDFNDEEREILLPYFLTRISLVAKSNNIELESKEYLIDPISDSFFKSPVPIKSIQPNEICMLRHYEDSQSNICKKIPEKNLHIKMKDHYFKPKSGLNHLIKDEFVPGSKKNPKYRAFFNIEKEKLLEKFSNFGFKTKEEFNNSLQQPYYYEKYIKYKYKYITLKNLFNNNN